MKALLVSKKFMVYLPTNKAPLMKKIFLVLFFCLSFFTKSSAQEDNRLTTIKNNLDLLKVEVPGLSEKVDVDISNTSLSNFLLAVSKVHKVNVNVNQKLNEIKIVNGFNDVIVADLFIFLVKEYDLDIDFTGNIISVFPFEKPKIKEEPKQIGATFNALNKTLSLDLKGEPLTEVFRRIMDVSGKNLLFSPQIKSKPLSVYIKEVPFDSAIEKLSMANGIEYEKSEDGFYVFNSIEGAKATEEGERIRPKRKKTNFFYEIVDYDKKQIAVDFNNTPIADIVYTIADNLKLDIFIASPLENAGTATVNAAKINFDDLLVQLFDSASSSNSSVISNQSNARNQNSSSRNTPARNTSNGSGKYTFKKENNLYYFGTEEQLTLKQTEFITLMHRSVSLLGDPSGAGQSTSASRYAGNFNSNNSNTSFQGNSLNSNTNNLNSNQNSGVSNQNNNFSQNRSSFNSGSNSSSSSAGDILSLFPESVLEGLDVKLDVELNGFVVSGPAVRVEKFKDFIKYIDKPVPVILIEVMILEVNRSSTVDTGIEFGLGEEAVTTQGVAFPDGNMTFGAATINRVIGGFDGFGSLNLGNVLPNFYMNIKAMESNGNLKILSTPKLSTLNGHKAYLSSGQTTYYEVTNQSFFGSQIPQTSEITNYQPIDAELSIEFKPFVSGDGQVTLEIQVVQSSFGSRIDENAPPDINSRRFSSIIRMKDKDVAILGGIEEKFKNDSGSGVPFLSRVPILKWLFSQRSRTDRKSKLNILVKPTIFN